MRRKMTELAASLAVLFWWVGPALSDAEMVAAYRCIDRKVALYADKSCEPAAVIVSAATSACYDELKRVEDKFVSTKQGSRQDAIEISNKTLKLLEKKFFQTIIETRIATNKECR